MLQPTTISELKSLLENWKEWDIVPNDIDTSRITKMNGLFTGSEKLSLFNEPIGNWNTKNVTDMRYMFSHACSFNQPIGKWNTEMVTNMDNMFDHAFSFNQPIGNWNTGRVRIMRFMFNRAESFNQPLTWDTQNVKNMRGMFYHAESFNQPLNWNTGIVTDMGNMFYCAKSFDQDLNNWNIKKVSSMTGMFKGATRFLFHSAMDQDHMTWDTTNVQNKRRMFDEYYAEMCPL